jgi:hypothetical protein
MARSERIRRHLQSNAVGYVAVFIALSGTAIALPGKSKVKRNDIARGAVVGKAIAPDAVKRAKIRNGAVGPNKLGDGAITAPKLAPGAVTGPAIASGAVDSTKVGNGSLLAEDFAPGQISDAFLFDDVTGPQTFTIQRPGRVYVTATVAVLCDTPPCNDGYEVQIDGTAVPGAEAVLPALTEIEQVTLVGLTHQLTAGAHQIELVSNTPSVDEVIKLSGILIQ